MSQLQVKSGGKDNDGAQIFHAGLYLPARLVRDDGSFDLSDVVFMPVAGDNDSDSDTERSAPAPALLLDLQWDKKKSTKDDRKQNRQETTAAVQRRNAAETKARELMRLSLLQQHFASVVQCKDSDNMALLIDYQTAAIVKGETAYE
jgi:hypothetical protein